MQAGGGAERSVPPPCHLKIVQESITLGVFVFFAWAYLGESFRWNYVWSFVCILGAVLFAFAGRR